jgi:hypothetical protein
LEETPTRPIARRRWPTWLPIVGWSLLGLLAATLLVFIATVTFGAVHGTEFCPQTFERRSYSYYELPLVGMQVTGERHEDLTGDTEKSITTQKFITPPAGGKQEWHVLLGSRGTRLRQPGDAHILMLYLDATDSDHYHRWLEWSNEHKELAQAMWPAVQRLALHELYIDIPDLFDVVKTIEDATKLKQELDRLVARKLLPLARKYEQHDNRSAAIKVLDEALSLVPADAEIQAARASLDKPEQEASR